LCDRAFFCTLLGAGGKPRLRRRQRTSRRADDRRDAALFPASVPVPHRRSSGCGADTLSEIFLAVGGYNVELYQSLPLAASAGNLQESNTHRL
jgi:hypothetical protein